MEDKKKCCCKRQKAAEEVAAQDYSGVAIDQSDNNDVDSALVKERTKTLNDNPRDNDE